MKDAIETAECKEYYPAEFDAEQYKLDFATLMSTLESVSAAKEETTEEEIQVVEAKKASFKDVMRAIFSSKYTRYAGSAAAGFALAVITGIATTNTINR